MLGPRGQEELSNNFSGGRGRDRDHDLDLVCSVPSVRRRRRCRRRRCRCVMSVRGGASFFALVPPKKLVPPIVVSRK